MLSLGIDIGTSGIRTAVVDDRGNVVSFARADHIPQTDGRIDANLWWDAVGACLDAQLQRLEGDGYGRDDIGYIAIDGTSGTMVLTDAGLNPVTRALMYDSKGFDAEAARIAHYAPDPHMTRGSGSALARALRLVDEDADHRAAHLLHQADFVAAKLIGRGGSSDVMNALKTGVEPDTGRWPDWIGSLLPERLLPQAYSIGACFGDVSSEVATRFGLPGEVKVHAGTTDSIAAFLAAAPLENGVAVTSLGSTLAIKLLSETRIDVPHMGLYSHRVGDVWLVGGASNAGGRVLRHYFSDDELTALSEKIDPEQDTPLDYYPLVEPGERFPTNDPALEPRLSPRPDDDAEFLHGIFDGIARIEARCYRVISDFGGDRPERILSVGGSAKNPVFTRIRARHLGQMPELASRTEAAIGAAMIPLIRHGQGQRP